MKTIYACDDCGYPISVTLSDYTLTNIKNIQYRLKALPDIPNISSSFQIECNPGSSSHGNHVMVEITPNGAWLEYPGWEDCTSILDGANLLTIDDVYFSDRFTYRLGSHDCEERRCEMHKKFMETMPMEHIELFAKKVEAYGRR